MSRISSSPLFTALASGDYRERDGGDAYNERQHNNEQYGSISEPVVRLVPQVHRIVHDGQERHHHHRQNEGGENRGVNRQLDRVYPRKPHQKRATDDVEGEDEVEDGGILGLLLLPILPAHDLSDLKRESQGYLRSRPETGDKQRGGKEVHSPDPERFDQPQAHRLKRLRLDTEGLKDHRAHQDDRDGRDGAESHPHNSYYPVGADHLPRPALLLAARGVEEQEVGRDDGPKDACGNVEVLRRATAPAEAGEHHLLGGVAPRGSELKRRDQKAERHETQDTRPVLYQREATPP